jgi:iturin family lipopeptide synthetase A
MDVADVLSKLETAGAKFEVVGDQLKIHASKDIMTSELLTFIRDNKAEVINRMKELIDEIKPAVHKPYYPASSPQRRLYFVYDLHRSSVAYNLPQIIEMHGLLDKEKLETASRQLIIRHEILRTSFGVEDGEPVQVISSTVGSEFEKYHCDRSEVSGVIEKFRRPFDLTHAPLIRFGLIETGERDYLLLIDMHHIVTDGVTHALLMKELIDLYKGVELPEVKLHYKDYSEWLRSEKQQKRILRQRDFWMNLFAQLPEAMELPVDFPRPLARNHRGDTLRMELDRDRTQRLRSLSNQAGATLFMTIFSLYNVLLAKFCNQEDIVIGSPVAGRSHADLENIPGMFVNILPLRNRPGGELTFREFLSAVRQNTLMCIDNQDYQYEDLINDLQMDRDISSYPLIDVMYTHQGVDNDVPGIPGLVLKPYDYDQGVSKFNLMLITVEDVESMYFEFQYSTELFEKGTVERLMLEFDRLISIVVDDPDRKIKGIELVSSQERDEYLYVSDRNERVSVGGRSVIDLFEEQVRKNPDEAAFRSGAIVRSYAWLKEQSDRVAFCLQADYGVVKGDLIGVALLREEWLLPVIVGIMKIGGVYVPLDMKSPAERVQGIVEDAGLKVLISRSEILVLFALKTEAYCLDLDRNVLEAYPAHPTPVLFDKDDKAYVIYTSGSTGRSKGVVIGHDSLLNYVDWAARTYVKWKGISFPLFTSVAFDLTITSTFVPLVTGNTINIYSENQYHDEIEQVLQDNRSEIVKLTPSHLKLLKYSTFFGDASRRSVIRQLIVGGEELTTELASDIYHLFKGNVEIYNEYGPTEATVGCMIHLFDIEEDRRRTVPIGYPIDNVRTYLFDKDFNLVPTGVPGDLYVAGAGVAKGYLHNRLLTEARFLENPRIKGERIYRTGDRARRLADGKLEFLGRKDDQVKINGYRIELGEIESLLSLHEGIRECKVVVKEKQDEKYIVAYYVSSTVQEITALRDYLSHKVPIHMIPDHFVRVEEIPLTINGKVNVRMLPDVEIADGDKDYSPSDETEEKLKGIWADILKVDRSKIDIDSNFFTLGGHSLRTYNLLHRIEKEFQINIPLVTFFAKPTIREIQKNILVAGLARLTGAQVDKVTI